MYSHRSVTDYGSYDSEIEEEIAHRLHGSVFPVKRKEGVVDLSSDEEEEVIHAVLDRFITQTSPEERDKRSLFTFFFLPNKPYILLVHLWAVHPYPTTSSMPLAGKCFVKELVEAGSFILYLYSKLCELKNAIFKGRILSLAENISTLASLRRQNQLLH